MEVPAASGPSRLKEEAKGGGCEATAKVPHGAPIKKSLIRGIFKLYNCCCSARSLSQIIFLNCYISNTVLQYFEIPSIFSYIEVILLLRAVTDAEIIIQSE